MSAGITKIEFTIFQFGEGAFNLKYSLKHNYEIGCHCDCRELIFKLNYKIKKYRSATGKGHGV